MAVDLHIVGWVEKRGIDGSTITDYAPQKIQIAAITATEPMLAKDPDVARLRPRFLRNSRNDD